MLQTTAAQKKIKNEGIYMVNELCELAASGVNAKQIGIFGALLIILGVIFFVLSKKRKLNVKWLMPVALLIFTIGTPFQQLVIAQSAGECSPRQSNSQTPSPGTPEALGGLIDDNPELAYDEDYGEYYATFSVLPNDNAPNGDSFDISTLQLLGEFPDPEYQYSFLILDPENPAPPATPNSPGNPDWANVWGYWYLELTCDPDDTDHCGTDPGDNIVCHDPSGGTCWPNGDVSVYLNSSAQPGVYTIQYTVNTQSGIPLIPATITVTVPETVGPSPITSYSVDGYSNGCDVWPNDFSLDLMDGSFFSTTGPGTLLANTIDLDPGTPGQQTTITIYDEDTQEKYVTYTVDNAGILTMTTPQSEYEGYNTYILNITIFDSNGFAPDTPATYTRNPACA